MTAPYLSIVACSRNDGHGENLVERMQLFVDGIADQAGRFGLDCELVLVEWNPPANKPGLADVLSYPEGEGHLACRVVVVPPAIHASLPHSDVLPLFQMIAKNVGIRRAHGRLILSTNIDILFPDALMRWLAHGTLDDSVLYRTDRADIVVPFANLDGVGLAQIRRTAPSRINRRHGVYDADGHRIVPVYSGLVDFALYRLRQLTRGQHRQVRPTKPTPNSAGRAGRARRLAGKAWRLATLDKPHAFGCGDFTMLSRDNWLRVGGHAEWPIYSWNLDALLLYQARAHGIAEVDLADEFTVMHMDHSKGSGWSPDGAGDLFARMASRGIPVFTDDDLVREIHKLGLGLMRRPTPQRYTTDTWGFADIELEERVVTGSGDSVRDVRHRARRDPLSEPG